MVAVLEADVMAVVAGVMMTVVRVVLLPVVTGSNSGIDTNYSLCFTLLNIPYGTSGSGRGCGGSSSGRTTFYLLIHCSVKEFMHVCIIRTIK